MTKSLIACLAGILFFTACNNGNSSTVGTYDREESSSSEKTDAANKEHENDKNNDSGKVYIDSSKSIDSSLRKKDTGVFLNEKSIKTPSKTANGEAKQ